MAERRRPRNGLWWVWLTWGMALVLWVSAGHGGLFRHLTDVGTVVAPWVAGCGLVTLILRRRGKCDMQLLKKKKNAAGQDANMPVAERPPAETPPPAHMPAPGALRDGVVTAIRKDVFIAPGSHLSGQLEAQGNIVAEGSVEGNITSSHQVRVDTGGVVKGDIRAAHIIINGLVTGRCYADAVSLLEQGRIEGDVFTEELSVERGGVFIGQSCLPEPGPAQKGRDTDTVTGVSPRDVPVMEAHQETPGKGKDKETTSSDGDALPVTGAERQKTDGQS